MKLLTTTLLAGLFLLLTTCGDSGPSEADLAAEAEAEQIEADNQKIATSVEDVETTADELVDVLDSLKLLFPEKQ